MLVVPVRPPGRGDDDDKGDDAAATAPAAAAAAAAGRALSQRQGLIYEGSPLSAGGDGGGVEEEVVAHLDGRDYLTRAQLEAKGLEPWARKVCVRRG